MANMNNRRQISGTLVLISIVYFQTLNSNTLASPQEEGDGFFPSGRALWPVVNVDKAENKSKVGVHVPIFFDMINDRNDETGKSRLDLSVLSGLVTVKGDKERTASGKATGPLVVSVFGIPVYSGLGARLGFDVRDKLEDTISGQQRALESMLTKPAGNSTELAKKLYANIRKANEKSFRAIADTFNRMAGLFSGSTIDLSEGPEAKQKIQNTLANIQDPSSPKSGPPKAS